MRKIFNHITYYDPTENTCLSMKKLLRIYTEQLKITDYLNLPTHRQDRSGYNVNLLLCVHIHKITHPSMFIKSLIVSVSFGDFSLSCKFFNFILLLRCPLIFAAVAFLQCAETQV